RTTGRERSDAARRPWHLGAVEGRTADAYVLGSGRASAFAHDSRRVPDRRQGKPGAVARQGEVDGNRAPGVAVVETGARGPPVSASSGDPAHQARREQLPRSHRTDPSSPVCLRRNIAPSAPQPPITTIGPAHNSV